MEFTVVTYWFGDVQPQNVVDAFFSVLRGHEPIAMQSVIGTLFGGVRTIIHAVLPMSADRLLIAQELDALGVMYTWAEGFCDYHCVVSDYVVNGVSVVTGKEVAVTAG